MLFKLHKGGADRNVGLGNGGAFGDLLKLKSRVGGVADNAAIVHAVYVGGGGDYLAEQVFLLHTRLDRTAEIFGEKCGCRRGGVEFFHRVGAGPRHLDVKTLELALEGVQSLKVGAFIVFRGVDGFQGGGNSASDVVHSFFESDIFV